MARAAVIPAPSLNPFGGSGSDFSAFNVGNTSNAAALAFAKAENEWQAGRLDNAAYLAALTVYANAQKANTVSREDAFARLEQMQTTIARKVLEAQVAAGQATMADLLAFDASHIGGVNQNSLEYLQRLNQLQNTESKIFQEAERNIIEKYKQGLMTSAQLKLWYEGQVGMYTSPEIAGAIVNRLEEVGWQEIQERDAFMVSQYNDGKLTPGDFLAYAAGALARYEPGTQLSDQWAGYIEGAQAAAFEDDLLYRYGVSQQYAELQKFIQSNSGPRGTTSTSTSSRRIWTGTQWKTVTSTTTKTNAPSPSEQAAWKALQVELADAKLQLTELEGKMKSLPTGGEYVTTTEVLTYYKAQLTNYAEGSDKWFAVQGKIDQLNGQLHVESVLAQQGLTLNLPGKTAPPVLATLAGTTVGKITYPSGGTSGPRVVSSGGVSVGGVTATSFLAGLGRVESGGSYTAKNATTGAYGKYQILPSNWSSWAVKAGLPANASMTDPENQEIVAAAAIARLAKSYGNDWTKVAAAWRGGVAVANSDPTGWTASARGYITKVLGAAGVSASVVQSLVNPVRVETGRTTTKVTALEGNDPDSRGAADIVKRTTAATNLGGLDANAFDNFYRGYEKAYLSEQETWTDTITGKVYWIGDDAAERLGMMQTLDQMRFDLANTEASDYTKSSGYRVNASVRLSQVVSDSQMHAIYAINVFGSGDVAGGPDAGAVNPLGYAATVLERQQVAIQQQLDRGRAQLDKGDVTGAYMYFRAAIALGNPTTNPQTAKLLAAASTLATVQSALGGESGIKASLGDKADTFLEDLAALTPTTVKDKLTGKETVVLPGLADIYSKYADLTDAFSPVKADGTKNPKVIIQLDGAGNPKGLTSGAGQVILAPNIQVQLNLDGTTKIVTLAPKGINPVTKMTEYADTDRVLIKRKVGNSMLDIWAQFQVGVVGVFTTKDGQEIPVYGKVIAAGDEVWLQNPMTGRWANEAITISTPEGFQAIPNGSGGMTYSWEVTEGGRGGSTTTYIGQIDASSGNMVVSSSTPNFNADPTVTQLGDYSQGLVADLLRDSFMRTGIRGPLDDIKIPLSGLTNDDVRRGFAQRGFLPPYSGPKFGGLSPDERGTSSLRSGNWIGVGPPINRSPAGMATNAAFQKASSAIGTYQPLPQFGGLSLESRDENPLPKLTTGIQPASTRAPLSLAIKPISTLTRPTATPANTTGAKAEGGADSLVSPVIRTPSYAGTTFDKGT